MKIDSKHYSFKQSLLPTFSLFASVGTLLCCALPALLVTLGAGATLAGLVSSAPWLVTLSKYKAWTFTLSALLVILSGYMLWRAKRLPCPTDPEKAEACQKLRRISLLIYFISIIIWFIGFFFAFIAVHVF